jgi:cytochrome c553
MKKLLTLSMVLIVGSVLSAVAGDAGEIYGKDCAKCHGANGNGDTKMGKKLGVKDYTDAAVQATLTDDVLAKAITEGVKDKDGKQVMKPAEGLSADDVKGLVAQIRKFKK